jgi:hypothetical protein
MRDPLNAQSSLEGDAGQDNRGNEEGARLPFLPARIIPLLFEPTKLFQAVRARPEFWGPILFAAGLIAFSSILIPSELYQEAARRQMAALGVEVPDMPEAAAAASAGIQKIMRAVAFLFGVPIGAAILAGVVSLIFRFGLGYEGSYRQHLSIVAHSSLIVAFAALLMTPLRIAAGRVDLALTLGTFVPFLAEGFLARFLQGVDLFNVWAYALIGVGISVVDGTRPARTAIVVMVGLVLVRAAVGAVFRGLAGM